MDTLQLNAKVSRMGRISLTLARQIEVGDYDSTCVALNVS